jgi:hypothetical protein
MRPTFDDLKDLWLIAYSRASLCEADCWIDDMATVKSPSLMKALVCSAVIAYARPFMESRLPESTAPAAPKKKKVKALECVSPPSQLLSAHTEMLSLRNKVLGHKDATPAQGHTETANKLLLQIEANGEVALHTTPPIEMSVELRRDLKALCAHFIAHCEKEFGSFVKKYRTELTLSPGPYQIFVSEPPDDWIKPGWPKPRYQEGRVS